ncbi:MAG: hypothetical protein NWF12_02980 [Candidatus Bathyarchaeota archaeon]|nr:hypothetical protein [Candidatus Bathyarchaeota archaeon]
MNFGSSPRDSTESSIALWILIISVSCGLLTTLAHADGDLVLNEMASTRSGVAYSVHVLEDYAFVTGNEGISVFDVSDPRAPSRVSTLELADGAFDFHLDGWVAYIAADEEGLVIADFSDPAQPEVIGTLDIVGVAFDVYVEGHHAYVADNLNGLRIVDVSDPEAPVEVGSHRFRDLRAVEVRDGVAYLAVPNTGLVVLDVSEPSSPSGASVVPGTYATINLHLSGDCLYLSCHGHGTRILDVSEPLDPEMVGEYSVDGGESYAVHDHGELLFVADLQKGAVLLDIGDPSEPRELARYGAQPHDIFYDGEYAYLACERGLVILQYGPPESDSSSGASTLLILLAAAALAAGASFVYLRSR